MRSCLSNFKSLVQNHILEPFALKSCDTLVYFSNNRVIFGKNSDRPANEAQLITYVPRKKHDKNTTVQCTYISIPQVEETHACLLSKPYWMWGAEMGCNEKGVCIGNEAVWTKEKYPSVGLTGMDLVRLGLERGSTAKESLNVIINLLEKYGQGGKNSVHMLFQFFSYHNSFLICDPTEAYVLETAGKWWVAEHITSGYRNISNKLSIQNAGTMRSEGLIEYAIKQGYCKDKESFNFTKIFSSYFDIPTSKKRFEGGKELLQKEKEVTAERMMDILRDHTGGLCMHGLMVATGSQVSVLEKDKQLHWFTVTSSPCKSVYIPFEFSENCQGVYPDKIFKSVDPSWVWSKGLKNPTLNPKTKELEKEMIKQVQNAKDKDERVKLHNQMWDKIWKQDSQKN